MSKKNLPSYNLVIGGVCPINPTYLFLAGPSNIRIDAAHRENCWLRTNNPNTIIDKNKIFFLFSCCILVFCWHVLPLIRYIIWKPMGAFHVSMTCLYIVTSFAFNIPIQSSLIKKKILKRKVFIHILSHIVCGPIIHGWCDRSRPIELVKGFSFQIYLFGYSPCPCPSLGTISPIIENSHYLFLFFPNS